MKNKTAFILFILALVTGVSVTTAFAADPSADLQRSFRAITQQSDDDELPDQFVEDGVIWYLHDDGYYYDVPPGEETGFEDENFWDDEESFVEDGVTWYLHDDGYYYDYPQDEDADSSGWFEWGNEDLDDDEFSDYSDYTEEELAEREASTTGKTPASPGEYLWQVALVDSYASNGYDGQMCGGSLIAKEWVLTAAHCLEGGMQASDIDIVIGRDVLSSNEGERIPAEKLILHKAYTSGRDENADIALIKLSRPATKGQIVSLANNQATGHLDDAGVDVSVSGWGLLNELDDTSPDRLHEAQTSIVSNAVCNVAYGGEINNSALCAGEAEGGKDSCQGDSGGPLVAFDGGDAVQVGVVSWGEGCGLAGYYGVYTRVATFQDWISQNMDS
ncbi:MAG: serine protease [Chloroflexota bacterium]